MGMRLFLFPLLLAACATDARHEADDVDAAVATGEVKGDSGLKFPDAAQGTNDVRVDSRDAAVVRDAAAPPAAAAVTWHQDIAPLVARKCGGCHQDGGIAPFSVQTYATTKPFARLMVEAVSSGTMPPFLAREGADCQPPLPWANDPRLSAEELALLKAWADAGAAEGEPKPPVTLPTPGVLEHEDVTVKIPREVVVDGNEDQHLCVVLDPKLTEDHYVSATASKAGNKRVVHHIKTLLVRPGYTGGLFGIGSATDRSKAQLISDTQAATGAAIGTFFECKAGDKLGSVPKEILDIWAPGGGPRRAPADAAVFVPRDSLIMLNLHYHPDGTRETDSATSFGLQFADAKPARVAQMAEIGNFPGDYGIFYPGRLVTQPGELGPSFVIPPGDSAHVEEMMYTWSTPSPVRIFSLFPHMHYVGRDIRVSRDRLAGSQCLIDTPAWDINWQLVYDYDASYEQLPDLTTGDVIRIRCQYDNTMKNKALAQVLESRGVNAPTEVRLGEDSTDEMCIVYLGVTYPNPR